eukprot:355383-Chlamydomonas_euryale.AAC.5
MFASERRSRTLCDSGHTSSGFLPEEFSLTEAVASVIAYRVTVPTSSRYVQRFALLPVVVMPQQPSWKQQKQKRSREVAEWVHPEALAPKTLVAAVSCK